MDLETEIRCFLNEICVDLGFCLPPNDLDMLTSRDHYIADEFVREIFKLEGLNPDLELKLFRQVKRRFTDKYGDELINR